MKAVYYVTHFLLAVVGSIHFLLGQNDAAAASYTMAILIFLWATKKP